jgi:hypothetical protein
MVWYINDVPLDASGTRVQFLAEERISSSPNYLIWLWNIPTFLSHEKLWFFVQG